MKKLALILVALLSLGVFTACGNDTPDAPPVDGTEALGETETENEETKEEPKKEEPKRLSDEEKAKYHKVVEFELPEGDFRDVIVDQMRKYSEIEWVAAESFGLNEVIGNNDWSVSLSYKKGTTYKGLPYTNYFVNYDTFESLLVNGTFVPDVASWRECPGMDCWSSIRCAFQQFDPLEGWTADWVPGQKTFSMDIVGGYKAPENPQSTQAVCEFNGKDVMYEAYLSAKKGDILYRKDFSKQDYLHCRVIVEDPTIAKTAQGKIIPTRSFLTTIEQTNQFDKTRKDKANTTWYVDHKYSLDALYDTDYVPITLKSYSKPLSEMEVPYIVLDNEITPSVLAKGTFSSNVKSNFPLRFVRIEILDKSGKTVVFDEQGDLQDVYKMALRNKFGSIFDELTKGEEYTLVLTVSISPGNAELARVDFTYNK